MKTTRIHLFFASFVTAVATGNAAAAPAIIDSEPRAIAALSYATNSITGPAAAFQTAVDYARRVAEAVLERLDATTTPAQLMHSVGGISMPCSHGGSVHARLARTFPRSIKVQWIRCRFSDLGGYTQERHGPTEIILIHDSFKPERLAGIRLGSAEGEYTDYREFLDPEQNSFETSFTRLRVTGLIPMVRAFPRYGLPVGPYAIEVTGFQRSDSRYELPDPTIPTYESSTTVTFENMFGTGSVTYNDAKTEASEVDNLHWGTRTWSQTSPGWGTSETGFTVRGLRSRRDYDYVAWTAQRWVDGNIEYRWGFDPAAGCPNLELQLRTKAPISGSLFSAAYDSGDLLINGSARWQFFSAANVPPGLPVPQQGMLAHLDVTGVGSFDYDIPGTYALPMPPGCF